MQYHRFRFIVQISVGLQHVENNSPCFVIWHSSSDKFIEIDIFIRFHRKCGNFLGFLREFHWPWGQFSGGLWVERGVCGRGWLCQEDWHGGDRWQRGKKEGCVVQGACWGKWDEKCEGSWRSCLSVRLFDDFLFSLFLAFSLIYSIIIMNWI